MQAKLHDQAAAECSSSETIRTRLWGCLWPRSAYMK